MIKLSAGITLSTTLSLYSSNREREENIKTNTYYSMYSIN